MLEFHFLISYLVALQAFAKDFHYYCKSFGKHLFADVAQDDLYDYIDQIKENVILGSGNLPYPSRVYLQIAAMHVPMISNDDHQNLAMLKAFVDLGIKMVNNIDGATRGQNALLDEIAGHLDKVAGLTFLQLRKFTPVEIKVQESVEVEHCKACIEKAVDRAKATLAKIDKDKVAKTVLDYEAKNLLVAEEEEEIKEEDIKDTLDFLSRKLGV